MPNVTAIDWKQADVFGPSFEQKGGMSHGFRLMPPFLLFQLSYPPHVGAVFNTQEEFAPENSEGG